MKMFHKSVVTLMIGVCLCVVNLTALVQAYQLNGYAYPTQMKSRISVYINPSLESMYGNVYAYTNKWSGLSGVGFQRAYEWTGEGISQSYVNTDNGTYGVCHYSSRTFKDISYHVLFKNASNSVKAETVVHEVGHALGLSHTQSKNNSISVMREFGFNGKAYPLSDDQAGIAAIY